MKVLDFDPQSQIELEPLPTVEQRLAELEKRMQRVERIQKYRKEHEECA